MKLISLLLTLQGTAFGLQVCAQQCHALEKSIRCQLSVKFNTDRGG